MKGRLPLLLLLIALLAWPGTGLAQVDNSAFYYQPLNQDSVGDFHLRFHGLGFNRNNEYFHPNEPGRTYFGYQLMPELAYRFNEKFRFSGGLYYRQDFGNPSPYQVRPVLRGELLLDSLTFVFGTLYGGLNHGLPLPIYAQERFLDNRLEEGLQFLYQNKGLKADLWVDWQKMIYDQANEQEAIWAGLTTSYTWQKNKFYAKAGVQLTVYHEGGQIDTTDERLIIWTNIGTELRTGYRFQTTYLQEVYGAYQWLHWDDFSPGEAQVPFENGFGHIFSAGLKSKLGTLQMDYHRMQSYMAPFASDIYTSFPIGLAYSPEVQYPQVSILFIRVLNDIHLAKGLTLTTRLSPYHDFTRGRSSFYNSLYLTINESFWLGRLKHRR